MRAEKSNIPMKLGLISVPVSVYAAVSDEKSDVTFNTVCTNKGAHDAVRVNQVYKCSSCDTTGKMADFSKGRAGSTPDSWTVVSQAEINAAMEAAVPADVKDSIALTAHPAEQVEALTLPGGKFYYVGPGKGAGEAYGVLAELIKSRPQVAFCTVFAIRTTPTMYRLDVRNNLIVMSQLAWPTQVKAAPVVTASVVNDDLLAMAMSYADTVMIDFDPTTFVDTRQQALAEFIASKDTAAPVAAPVAPSESPLLAALRAATAPAKPARKTPVKKPVVTAPAKPVRKAPAKRRAA